MTDSNKSVSPLRQRMIDDMTMRKLNPKTQAGHPSIPADGDGLPDMQPSQFMLGQNCLNCHTQSHGSNHPSGSRLMR